MCDWGTHQSVTLCFNVSVYATFYVSECHFCAGIPTLHLRRRGSFCSDACASSTRSGRCHAGGSACLQRAWNVASTSGEPRGRAGRSAH